MNEGENKNTGRENLERFRQIVLADVELQKQFRATNGIDEFFSAMIQAGAKRDLHFTQDDVRNGLRESRRAWLERWT